MRKGIARRAGVSLAAATVLAGITGCQSDSSAKAGHEPRTQRTPAQALTAAYQKTAGVHSAKVTMTMSVPKGMPDSGETKMTGTMAWKPTALDMTMSDDGAKAKSGDDNPKRMIWVDGVAYMDMGDFGGKKWGKLDLKAAAKEAGDEEMTKAVTAGLDDAEQDPAQQLAMFLGSPDIQHLGSGQVGGVRAEHYKGSLTVEEGLKGAKTVDALKPADREKLLANVKKSGIKGYDYDVWVNGDDLPVRMTVDVQTPMGTISTSASYSEYGTTAAIKAPPAAETTDLLKILKEAAGRGGTRSFA
ncbi:hypothetical protein [Streptomyces paromomycinus]|uniref:Putative lipoprotein n=1 Tax=Streptomyces paromomycinus TaxID=92743 RepID=A0A401VZ27_STREY|nr:hypothetical protein [Streptomyces paromomycinus]GCD42333.1 putative lipoprotein [Streptomyces paromomycinus]